MNTTKTDTEIVRQFHALRKSGSLPTRTQARANDIDRALTLANKFGGERYTETIARAASFVDLCDELGLGTS